MQDFEKNRAEYVTHLELQVKALQAQLAEAQSAARWEPKIGTKLDPMADEARITISFDGKNQTAIVPYELVRTSRIEDVSTAVLETMKDMIFDRFRTAIGPDIGRIQIGVNGIQKAGQW